MAQVVVAASIDNELRSKDIAELKRLKQEGYQIQLFYYLPRVPAEFSMIPSVNSELQDWKLRSIKLLNKIGGELGVPEENRHFVDEVLGPDKVFDAAKALDAKMILTSHPKELKQRFLSRLFDRLLGGEHARKVVVSAVDKFAASVPVRASEKPHLTRSETESTFTNEKSHGSVWTKESDRNIRSQKSAKLNKQESQDKKDRDDENQEDRSYNKKR